MENPVEIHLDTDTREFINNVRDLVDSYMMGLKEYQAKDMGLDPRCGRLYADEEHIVVDKSRDGTLQYYGGFEYIDKENRIEVGDYVFYSANDSRVNNCLSKVFDTIDEMED